MRAGVWSLALIGWLAVASCAPERAAPTRVPRPTRPTPTVARKAPTPTAIAIRLAMPTPASANARVVWATLQSDGLSWLEALEFPRAESVLREAVDAAEALGAEDQAVGLSLHALSIALDQQGMSAEASSLLRQATAVYEQNPRLKPLNTWEIYRAAGETAEAQGDDARAERLYVAAIGAVDASGGLEYVMQTRLSQAVDGLGHLYIRRHDDAAAARVYSAYLTDVYSRYGGVSDSDAALLSDYEGALKRLGKQPADDPLLVRALKDAAAVERARR